jgi:hypothetical protein
MSEENRRKNDRDGDEYSRRGGFRGPRGGFRGRGGYSNYYNRGYNDYYGNYMDHNGWNGTYYNPLPPPPPPSHRYNFGPPNFGRRNYDERGYDRDFGERRFDRRDERNSRMRENQNDENSQQRENRDKSRKRAASKSPNDENENQRKVVKSESKKKDETPLNTGAIKKRTYGKKLNFDEQKSATNSGESSNSNSNSNNVEEKKTQQAKNSINKNQKSKIMVSDKIVPANLDQEEIENIEFITDDFIKETYGLWWIPLKFPNEKLPMRDYHTMRDVSDVLLKWNMHVKSRDYGRLFDKDIVFIKGVYGCIFMICVDRRAFDIMSNMQSFGPDGENFMFCGSTKYKAIRHADIKAHEINRIVYIFVSGVNGNFNIREAMNILFDIYAEPLYSGWQFVTTIPTYSTHDGMSGCGWYFVVSNDLWNDIGKLESAGKSKHKITFKETPTSKEITVVITKQMEIENVRIKNLAIGSVLKIAKEYKKAVKLSDWPHTNVSLSSFKEFKGDCDDIESYDESSDNDAAKNAKLADKTEVVKSESDLDQNNNASNANEKSDRLRSKKTAKKVGG